MKTLITFALLLLAVSAFGQSATLAVPVTHTSTTKVVVSSFTVARDCICATVAIEMQDASGAAKTTDTLSIPADQGAPGTEFSDFLTAIGSAAPGETGTTGRRMNYRILRYLTVTYPRIVATPNP